MIKISLIVAAADNGVIGNNNQLPWKISDDLKYFKRVTMGLPIIMGRKTFDSIGRALPGRPNIVITRQGDWVFENVTVVSGVNMAIEKAKALAADLSVNEVMIMGGSEIYKQSLSSVDRIYQTQVHGSPEGDAFFPALDKEVWREISREDHQVSDGNEYPFSFVVFEKRR